MTALSNYLVFSRNILVISDIECSLWPQKSLNKALYLSALFSLGKVLVEASFQYPL